VPKALIFAVLGSIVLAVILVGAGVAYVYFGSSGDENIPLAEETDRYYNEPVLSTEEPAPDANVGVSMQSLTTPVVPGSNATFTVRTLRGAECDVVVEYDDIESQDSGLISKTADEYGLASWTWTVEEWVPEGEWPVEATCRWNEQSGELHQKLHVSYEAVQ